MSEDLGKAVLVLDVEDGPLKSKLNAAGAETEGRLSSMAQRITKVGKSLSSAGRELSMKVTLPILAVGAISGKMAVDFEKAMRNVNSIARLPEPAFQRINREVLAMAGRTAQAPITLAEGLYDLVSSGFDAHDSLVILEASAKAATAGLTTTEVSTKAVAAALNAYHLPASKATAISDDLFQTVNLGVVSFSELASTIGYVLPAASTMGVDLKQVGASISTLTKEGQSGSNAVTNINAALTAFIKPSKAMKGVLNELGYETSRQLVTQKGFQGAIEAVTKAVGGGEEAIGKLFPNVRAMRAVFGLTGASAKSAGQDLRGFQNDAGATAKVLAEQKKSVAYQWNQLKADASRMAIEIGKALIPVVVPIFRKIAEAVGSVGRAFTQASPATQRFIIIAAAIAAGVGPALSVLGGLVEMVGALFSPLTLTVVAIAALVAAFIHLYMTSANVRTAVSNIGSLLAAMGSAIWPMVTAIAGLALKIAAFGLGLAGTKAGVMLLGAAVGALIGRMIALGAVWAIEKVAAFVGAIAGVVSEIRMAVEAVGAFRAATMALSATIDGALVSTGIGALLVVAGSVVGALMGMSTATDRAKTSADQLTQSLDNERNALQEVKDIGLEESQAKANLVAANLAVQRAEKRVAELRKQGHKGTLEYREAENQLTQARLQAKRAGDEVSRSDEKAQEKRHHLAAATREASKEAEARIKTLMQEKAAVLAAIATEGESAERHRQLATVNEGLSRTLEELGNSLGHVPKKLRDMANAFGKLPKKKQVDVEVKDKNTAGKTRSIVSGISNNFKALSPKLQSQGSNAINSLRNGMAQKVPAALALAGNVPPQLKAKFGSLPGLLVSAGAALMQGLAQGILNTAAAAASAAANAAKSVASAAKGALGIHSPSKVFEEIGHNVIRGLASGIEGMSGTLTYSLERGIVEPLMGVQKKVEAIFDAMQHNVEAIAEAVQMVEQVGSLKVEKAREAAESAGSEGGAEVTAKEHEGIESVQAQADREAIAKFRELLAAQEKEAKELPGHISKLSVEAAAEGKREKEARDAARKEQKKLRGLERQLQHAKTDAEKKALHEEIRSVSKAQKAAEKAAEKAEKLRSKLGDRITELKDRLQELVGATGRGGAIFATLIALAKLNAIPMSDLPHFATGVLGFEGGPAEVGERGPELVGHGIANLAKGVDVLDANMTRRLLSAHRRLSAGLPFGSASKEASAVASADKAPMDRLADAIERLNETGTADVLEALVKSVSDRQGYKHLRKRRRTAGDGRMAIA